MRKTTRGALAVVLLALVMSGCGGDSSSGGSSGGKTQAEREQYARNMCDSNEGGYHIDQKCYNRYMGR